MIALRHLPTLLNVDVNVDVDLYTQLQENITQLAIYMGIGEANGKSSTFTIK